MEIRALTGKEGGPETWGGDVCGTQVKLMVSESQVAVEHPMWVVAVFLPVSEEAVLPLLKNWVITSVEAGTLKGDACFP